MTDYLEVLLRQETEEDEETVAATAAVLRPAGAGMEAAVHANGAEEQRRAGAERFLLSAGWIEKARTEPPTPVPVRQEVAWTGENAPRRAAGQEKGDKGERERESAWNLYRTLRRLSFAVSPAPKTAALLLPAEEIQSPGWSDLAGLDRRLEREARRYDGGFRLY